MTNEPTAEHRVLVTQVHERVGRNVVRVQSLESSLKALVPLLDLDGAAHCLDGLADRHMEVSKNTLGQLVGSFLGSVKSDDPRFADSVTKVLNDRNNLVHHFRAIFGNQMSTVEGCTRVSVQLDEEWLKGPGSRAVDQSAW